MEFYLTVKDIVDCTKGKLIIGDEKTVCENFSSDTREINKDDVFVGLKGEKFNGGTFWKEAFNNGAKVVIVQDIDFIKEELELYKEKVIIQVENVEKALCDMATKKRELYGNKFPVVAVTGSVGKTSTKDTIATVLSEKYNVLKTEANNNNNIGLPFTILRLKNHDVAVIEMGMNHLGEISELSKIAKPSIAVITNIGTSHIGNLGSRENILKAKLEILDGMENPVLIVNNDNDLLHDFVKSNKNKLKIKTFGMENSSDVFAENVVLKENESYFKCHVDNEFFDVKIPVGGSHFVYNVMSAILVGKILGISNERIKAGIEKIEVTKKRMEIVNLANNITIINDSYNASYESMKAAIEYLKNIKNGRKIAVLGDMLELGDFAQELHGKVGEEVAKNNIDLLICCGENSKFIVDEAIKTGMKKENTYYLKNIDEIKSKIEQVLQKGDIILIKASHAMNFSKLADNIIEEWGK